MKAFFGKRWVKVIVLGALIAAVLIAIDERKKLFPGLFNDSGQEGNYSGPVSMDKESMYFAVAKMDSTTHHFGAVKEGDTLMHVFHLTNTGKEPLFIYNVKGSCDCVKAGYPKEAIPPGTEVEIKVYFDTRGRKGPQDKKLELVCNTDPAEVVLRLVADVK